jgi:hypothetical protein
MTITIRVRDFKRVAAADIELVPLALVCAANEHGEARPLGAPARQAAE